MFSYWMKRDGCRSVGMSECRFRQLLFLTSRVPPATPGSGFGSRVRHQDTTRPIDGIQHRAKSPCGLACLRPMSQTRFARPNERGRFRWPPQVLLALILVQRDAPRLRPPSCQSTSVCELSSSLVRRHPCPHAFKAHRRTPRPPSCR